MPKTQGGGDPRSRKHFGAHRVEAARTAETVTFGSWHLDLPLTGDVRETTRVLVDTLERIPSISGRVEVVRPLGPVRATATDRTPAGTELPPMTIAAAPTGGVLRFTVKVPGRILRQLYPAMPAADEESFDVLLLYTDALPVAFVAHHGAGELAANAADIVRAFLADEATKIGVRLLHRPSPASVPMALKPASDIAGWSGAARASGFRSERATVEGRETLQIEYAPKFRAAAPARLAVAELVAGRLGLYYLAGQLAERRTAAADDLLRRCRTLARLDDRAGVRAWSYRLLRAGRAARALMREADDLSAHFAIERHMLSSRVERLPSASRLPGFVSRLALVGSDDPSDRFVESARRGVEGVDTRRTRVVGWAIAIAAVAVAAAAAIVKAFIS